MKYEVKNRGRINPIIDVIDLETKEIVKTFDDEDWNSNYDEAKKMD